MRHCEHEVRSNQGEFVSVAVDKLVEAFAESGPFRRFVYSLSTVGVGEGKSVVGAGGARTIAVERLAGGAFSVAAAAALRERGGVQVFVMQDRDAAAYLAEDLYNLCGGPAGDSAGGGAGGSAGGSMGGEVLFFPTSYKRSAKYGAQDVSAVVQRTGVLSRLSEKVVGQPQGGAGLAENNFAAICTYPEALAEGVPAPAEMAQRTLKLAVGQTVSMSTVEDALIEWGFTRVDFVFEPGQYSIRGGIFDIFSFSSPKPFRVDFFGDEVESIRLFEISSQLSAVRVDGVEVVPEFSGGGEGSNTTSFAEYVGVSSVTALWWVDDLGYTLGTLDKLTAKRGAGEFLAATAGAPMVVRGGVSGAVAGGGGAIGGSAVGAGDIADKKSTVTSRVVDETIEFHTAPQPEFNKQFRLLAANIMESGEGGYETCILSENRAQIERLGNILAGENGGVEVPFTPLLLTLHEGFVDHDLKINLYTDHQIFERYHRYKIRGEINRDEALTVAELNELKTGDFVVHIDHGVGRFGGLVKQMEGGRETDAIKLVYKDGDVLLVGVNNLHRISRYKSGDTAEPPRVYKLGSGAWQRLKASTKNAVKSIARELIALYAKRKAAPGFAFSPDTYLQTELEASFRYEDTPDQYNATQAVKADMESPQPMDRLVCGDVGFGKTEVAIRAAFKAVADSKQVAVLVPTTILSLQHYRTFSERLRAFPVKIEFLNRSKTAAETRAILADVEAGKIDILIGTHKILGKAVKFRDLGLLVIDEEQKFGVASKEKLREMSVSVDTLTLTATPIPRTLQFSLMGSRDLSLINTPPPNRQPIVTESHVWDEELLREVVEAELGRGGQVYFVHNRVQDIVRIADIIRRLVPRARVAVLHGQMEPKQVEKLIMEFIYGEFDVLVATTIIENGIDIPNANTIVINNAQNFGLSDLHQLRGRVGRSDRKGYCYLLSPADELLSGDARRRLRAIEEFSDLGAGFNIAMQDLDIRGAGNLFGAEQSGFISDIGFETYQKILNEAVAELRAEGVEGAEKLVGGGVADTVGGGVQAVRYIDDAHIEIGSEAGIPDDYVASSAEKLKLYRQLDAMTDEASMQRFAASLEDRFGPIPAETQTLMDVVRLRWLAVALGFERVKVKNGLAIVAFPSDSESLYYKSDVFNRILQFILGQKEKFVLKQNNNKLGLTVRQIPDLRAAIETFGQMMPSGK